MGVDVATGLSLSTVPATQELRKQFQVISELRAEIRSLQSDNLKLYEKVRYMQSYREDNAHSTLDPLPAASTSAPSASELNKYSARYEEAMNPFEAFRGRVRPTNSPSLPSRQNA